MARLLAAHLRNWGIAITRTEVKSISRERELYVLRTAKGTFSSRFLVIATGTRPRSIELRGLDRLPKENVYYEIADVRKNVRGKKYLIIGGGDAAFDYALNLASRGCLTDIVFKSQKPRCLPLLLARARKEKRVRIFPRTTPDSVGLVDGRVSLECRELRGRLELQGDAILIACGREPNLDLLLGSEKLMETSTSDVAGQDGLFIVGDVRRGLCRQVGIAVGDGIAAAMMIVEKLREDSDEDNG